MPSNVASMTGAPAGIGAVHADRRAARGYDLVLVARPRDRREALAARLHTDHGRGAEAVTADLSDEEDLARVGGIVRDHPDLDMVANNGAFGAAVSVSAGEMDRMVGVDVLALSRLSPSAARRFSAVARGAIVNIGSMIAPTRRIGANRYSGSKSHVLDFTRSLRAELAGAGATVQVVTPGPVRTEAFGGGSSPHAESLPMTPEAPVDAALAALAIGETVTFRDLERAEAWLDFEPARQDSSEALREGSQPVTRDAEPRTAERV